MNHRVLDQWRGCQHSVVLTSFIGLERTNNMHPLGKCSSSKQCDGVTDLGQCRPHRGGLRQTRHLLSGLRHSCFGYPLSYSLAF